MVWRRVILWPDVSLLIYTRLRCITCLLYTSDAADERSSVDLGGRRIIKKKKEEKEKEKKKKKKIIRHSMRLNEVAQIKPSEN